MSKYGWEKGTIKIPPREWAGLKKSVRDAYNQFLEQQLRIATQCQAAMLTHFKGKRGVASHEVTTFCERFVSQRIRDDLAQCNIEALVRGAIKPDHAYQSRKFTQAMVGETLGLKATNKTTVFGPDSGSNQDSVFGPDGWVISFDDSSKRVIWIVSENNNAVEKAHEHPVAQAFFSRLNQIDFGNRTSMGGVIVGNDEYNEDADFEGGGANYVTHRYGKAGESDVDYAWRRRRSRRRRRAAA